jgi:hypothetical protein
MHSQTGDSFGKYGLVSAAGDKGILDPSFQIIYAFFLF